MERCNIARVGKISSRFENDCVAIVAEHRIQINGAFRRICNSRQVRKRTHARRTNHTNYSEKKSGDEEKGSETKHSEVAPNLKFSCAFYTSFRKFQVECA